MVKKSFTFLGRFGAFWKYRISIYSSTMVKKSLIFLSQFCAFDSNEFQNFLQPGWRNRLPFRVNLEHFGRTEFQNFLQPWWRNHLPFWVTMRFWLGPYVPQLLNPSTMHVYENWCYKTLISKTVALLHRFWKFLK